jgi:hypothetical protein
MNTDKVTSVAGGLYGVEEFMRALNALTASGGLTLMNGLHVLGAVCILIWAYFTNK